MSPRLATAPKAERAPMPLLGVALGLALGSAAFLALVPLADAFYHWGGLASMTLVRDASVRAALLWCWCAAGGSLLGALIGASVPDARAAELGRVACAAIGLHLLALRGLWGFPGPPPDARDVLAGPPLPGAAWVLPLLAALAAAGTLFAFARRSATPTRAAAVRLALAQAALALAAAAFVTQLPYYASRREVFLAGLREMLGLF